MLRYNDLSDLAEHLEDVRKHLTEGGSVLLWDTLEINSEEHFNKIEAIIKDFKNKVIEEYKKSVAPPERGTRKQDKEVIDNIITCKNEGLSDIESIKKLDIPRATYYRFKKMLKEQGKL